MKINSFFGGCLTTIILLAGTALIFKRCQNEPVDKATEETTTVSRDTIPFFIDTPIPRDSTVLRYESIKVPVLDTIRITVADTLLSDSVTVKIPITQKVYQDSTYQAWVSGYKPSLDSIQIFQPITTVTHTITNTKIKYKIKRWGVGVQVGVGLTPNKVDPYVGIGVTYNILSW